MDLILCFIFFVPVTICLAFSLSLRLFVLFSLREFSSSRSLQRLVRNASFNICLFLNLSPSLGMSTIFGCCLALAYFPCLLSFCLVRFFVLVCLICFLPLLNNFNGVKFTLFKAPALFKNRLCVGLYHHPNSACVRTFM